MLYVLRHEKLQNFVQYSHSFKKAAFPFLKKFGNADLYYHYFAFFLKSVIIPTILPEINTVSTEYRIRLIGI